MAGSAAGTRGAAAGTRGPADTPGTRARIVAAMAVRDVVRFGEERLRLARWRDDSQVGYLTPVPGRPPPSPRAVQAAIDAAVAHGYAEVVTAALNPAEQRPFTDAGFEPHEHLHLLAHDLRNIPDASDRRLRRGRRNDRAAVLEVDRAAFNDFWYFDDRGFGDALSATPTARFRVADRRSETEAPGSPVGYAICGRAGTTGYVQRLAVHPNCQRRGLGRALLLDGLTWLHKRGCNRAMVNTQTDNHAAFELYERSGFVNQSHGLTVLRWVAAGS